jgi:dsDNA-binding SOS-regulon protein
MKIVKKDADAYDRVLDAASYLADLIDACGIEMDEYVLEELTIYLASNAKKLREIFAKVKI